MMYFAIRHSANDVEADGRDREDFLLTANRTTYVMRASQASKLRRGRTPAPDTVSAKVNGISGTEMFPGSVSGILDVPARGTYLDGHLGESLPVKEPRFRLMKNSYVLRGMHLYVLE
ncbi:hypothetical protein Trydic_g7175 [Trypoxylus dichotomus]